MNIERRIIAAIKVADAVRMNITLNGGIYSGAMVPNIQSVIDILTLPDAELAEQLDRAALQFACARVSAEEVRALHAAWSVRPPIT